MGQLKKLKQYLSFGGTVTFYSHESESTKTPMNFSVFHPPQEYKVKVPVLFWLSGLTCNEENFITKAGAQMWASHHGIMLVCPDTSPRGTNLPGEHDSWDFGSGAGFYVNAVTPGWSEHYRMYDYVVKELPDIVASNFNADMDRIGISGHSMGGHGALVLGLRNPELYKSISAFSPIGAPSLCPWGKKAFTGYLGEDKELWKEYDASELVKTIRRNDIVLVDQGTDDEFLKDQLLLDYLVEACHETKFPLKIRMQRDYDHSYYFIATFIKDHIEFHAENFERV